MQRAAKAVSSLHERRVRFRFGCCGLGTAGPPEICERRLSKAECQRIGPSRSNRQIISIFAMSAVGTGSQLDPLHRRKAAPSPSTTLIGRAASWAKDGRHLFAVAKTKV